MECEGRVGVGSWRCRLRRGGGLRGLLWGGYEWIDVSGPLIDPASGVCGAIGMGASIYVSFVRLEYLIS